MTPLPKIQSIISSSIAIVRLDFVYDLRKGFDIYLPQKVSSLQASKNEQSQYTISNTPNKTFNYPFVSAGIKRYEYESQNESINYGLTSNDPSTTDFIEYPKLIVSRIVEPRIKAIFFENAAIVDQSFSIIIEKSEDFSLLFLLGLLNSKLFTYFVIEQSPKQSKNISPTLHLKLLESLPIVICDPIDQSQIADLAYELSNLKTNYDAFKKSFINLMESKFDCTLNAKIFKEWPELKFSELVKELAKENVKLSSLEETEWKKYFNNQKTKALEIKSEIEEIDEEIDQIIYELYELSEEIILVVERSIK